MTFATQDSSSSMIVEVDEVFQVERKRISRQDRQVYFGPLIIHDHTEGDETFDRESQFKVRMDEIRGDFRKERWRNRRKYLRMVLGIVTLGLFFAFL